jgi:pyruvate dehydrogenase E2 component (dihydrolipoamide acetyltransferase)
MSSRSAFAATQLPLQEITLCIPAVGDFGDVSIVELQVRPGDSVSAGQNLITVESDRTTTEVPSTCAGVLKAFTVKVGDRVSHDSPFARMDVAAGADAHPVDVHPTVGEQAGYPDRTPNTHSRSSPSKPPARSATSHASPSTRQLARELGVSLDSVVGSGHKGRVTDDDVHTASRTSAAIQPDVKSKVNTSSGVGRDLLPWPVVDFTSFGPVEHKNLSRIRRISGASLHRNWVSIPHVTNHDDADVTELEALRVQLNKENEKSGVKVTMLAFLIKACVAALKKFPDFNASLDGEQIVLKQYFHIGFAADTPNGLVVPVIKDADKKGVLQISQEMRELAKKARDGKLGSADMSGGCFSISSLGGIGGRYFTPIINAPEVSILGVGKSSTEPHWDGGAFQPRLILPLSLSWDHRVIDGASAARFNAHIGQTLADFRTMAL